MVFGVKRCFREINTSHNPPRHESEERSVEALGKRGSFPTWSRVRADNAAMISRSRAE